MQGGTDVQGGIARRWLRLLGRLALGAVAVGLLTVLGSLLGSDPAGASTPPAPLGGLGAATGGVLDPVVAPVDDAVAPIVEPLAPAVAPIVEPLAPVVAPVVEPLAPVVAPVVGNLALVVAPLAPVAGTVGSIVAPVAGVVAPTLGAVAPLVEPLTAPIADALAPARGIVVGVTDLAGGLPGGSSGPTLDAIVVSNVLPVTSSPGAPGPSTVLPIGTPGASFPGPPAGPDESSGSDASRRVRSVPVDTEVLGTSETAPSPIPVAPLTPAHPTFPTFPASTTDRGDRGSDSSGTALAVLVGIATLILASQWRRCSDWGLRQQPPVLSLIERPG